MQWFIANKAELRNSNSKATEKELTKIGRSIYSELTQKRKDPEDTNEATEQSNAHLNKRKLNLEDERDETGIAKLAKFGFAGDE